jgi:hypothetical protein
VNALRAVIFRDLVNDAQRAIAERIELHLI